MKRFMKRKAYVMNSEFAPLLWYSGNKHFSTIANRAERSESAIKLNNAGSSCKSGSW
jgi:hypothetical protein